MTFKISSFPVLPEYFYKFKRWVKKPKDCVINTLELLNIIDNTCADLMRIVVGDTGLFPDPVLNIFKYVYPNHEWNFCDISNIQSLASIAANLPINHVMVCTGETTSAAHIFLIGKNYLGKPFLIDPHIGHTIDCDLTDISCYNILKSANFKKFSIICFQ